MALLEATAVVVVVDFVVVVVDIVVVLVSVVNVVIVVNILNVALFVVTDRIIFSSGQ